MISFRDITDLEPITSIPDNADIVVVVDGVAKRISKENAKFGGGAVEKKVFYIGRETTSGQSANAENGIAVHGGVANYTLYKDAELTTLATAQEVFDALDEGSLMMFDEDWGYLRASTCYWWSGTKKFGDKTQVTYVSLKNYIGTVVVGTRQSE